MKKLFNLSIIALLMLSLFSACGDKDEETPTLSIDPSQTALAFSAAATESYVISVSTNQGNWDAVSDQTWCKVSKSGSTFTVTASANSSTNAPAPAKITVKAGTAQPITINVTQSGLGAELSLSPQGPLQFSAEGTESYEITVTTNQASWDAVSDKSWCKIEKSTGKFIVTTSQNLTEEEVTATITISAGNAANVTIIVNQAAKNSGGNSQDTGKSIWDDTHWRLFKLKANPKQILNESGSIFAEFNSEGKITYYDYDRYEYDNKGRLVKIIELGDNEGDPYPSIPSKSTFVKKHKKGVHGKTKSTKSSEEYSKTFEYGDHSKYIPSFVSFYIDNANVDYLLKGVTAVTETEDREKNRMTLNVSGASVTGKYESSWQKIEYAFTYSGNYPLRATLDEEYDEDGYIGTQNRITDYKYGENYKYSEIHEIENDEYKTPSGDNNKHTYTTKTLFKKDATIYLLPISEEWSNDTSNSSMQNEYDDEGRLIKTTHSGGSITTYSDYEIDSKGNWIKRKISHAYDGVGSDSRTETRKIIYF